MSKRSQSIRRFMMKALFGNFFVANLLLAAPMAIGQEKKDDPEFVSVGIGAFDFNRRKDEGFEYRLEYRSDRKLLKFFKPFGAVAVSTSGHGFFGGGVLIDLFFDRRIVVTPSFAPHIYIGGDNDLDLDYPLQFRSQLEIAYRLDNRARVGFAVSHYSNASLGDKNPGTETATIYYSLPLEKIISR